MSEQRTSRSEITNEFFDQSVNGGSFGIDSSEQNNKSHEEPANKQNLNLNAGHLKIQNVESTLSCIKSSPRSRSKQEISGQNSAMLETACRKRSYKEFILPSIDQECSPFKEKMNQIASDLKQSLQNRRNHLENGIDGGKYPLLDIQSCQLRNFVPATTKSLATNLDSYKVPSGVWQDFTLLILHIFIEKCMTQHQFSEVCSLSKQMVICLLEHLLKSPEIKIRLTSFEHFNKINNIPPKKRTEEILKMIYKLFIKKQLKAFVSQHFVGKRQRIKSEYRHEYAQADEDFKKYFFLNFFQEDFQKFDQDLVMDLVAEKLKLKGNEISRLSRDNNWQTIEKFRLLRTISKSLRFIFLSNKIRQVKFFNYISTEDEHGMLDNARKIGKSKILKKISQWRDHLLPKQENSQQFLKGFKKSIQKKGFKFAWRLSDYRYFACQVKKESCKTRELQDEFETVRGGHYSYQTG